MTASLSAREARERFQVIGNYGLTYFNNTVRDERYRWLVSRHSDGEPLEEFATYREALKYIRDQNVEDERIQREAGQAASEDVLHNIYNLSRTRWNERRPVTTIRACGHYATITRSDLNEPLTAEQFRGLVDRWQTTPCWTCEPSVTNEGYLQSQEQQDRRNKRPEEEVVLTLCRVDWIYSYGEKNGLPKGHNNQRMVALAAFDAGWKARGDWKP